MSDISATVPVFDYKTKQWSDDAGFAYDSTAGQSLGDASSRVQGESLGQEEFFKLLTTQLASQDPLEPMDDTAFISQMASFSALEMQSELTTSFNSYSEDQTFIGAQSMIGNQVSILSNGNYVEGIAESVEKNGDSVRVFVDGQGYDISSVSRVGLAGSGTTSSGTSSETDDETTSTEPESASADTETVLVNSVRQVSVSDGGPTSQ